MFIFARLSLLLLVFGCFVACQSEEPMISPIHIGAHAFDVQYALTAEQKRKGLMFVEDMPDNHGMVFLYPKQSVTKFWMRNTLIPLDMLFFDKDMKLVHIENSATPHDLSPRGPNTPVCIVVEINGGMAETLNIQMGEILSLNRPYKCLH